MMRITVFTVVAALAVASLGTHTEASLTCDGCKWVVGKLQGYLVNNTKLENETVTLVDQDICSHFPKKYVEQCDNLAAAYLPSAMEALEAKFLDPTFVCGEIHACKQEGPFGAEPSLELGGDNLECKLCKLATGFVAKKMETNSTETKVEDDIEKLCQFVPKALKSKCELAIQEETPRLLEDLAQKLASDGCEDVHICKDSDYKQMDAPEDESNGGIECALCDLVVGKLQSFVENSTTLDDKVEEFLEDDFCTLLPKSVQAICNSTVATETPNILYSLADRFLNADTDCAAIGLCKKDSEELAAGAANGGLECAICQKLAGLLDADVLENPKVEGFVVKELDGVCGMLPKGYEKLCDAAAKGVAPKLMAKIGELIASQGCTDIHVCKQ